LALSVFVFTVCSDVFNYFSVIGRLSLVNRYLHRHKLSLHDIVVWPRLIHVNCIGNCSYAIQLP